MTIGVLREGGRENRVALLPDNISKLLKENIAVLIESDAGTSSCASNEEYVDAGAQIQTREYILRESDVILKINPPEEMDIPAGKILVSILNPLSNTTLVRKLAESGVTSFSLDMQPSKTSFSTPTIPGCSSEAPRIPSRNLWLRSRTFKALVESPGRIPFVLLATPGWIRPGNC